jgi:hypothetical protein
LKNGGASKLIEIVLEFRNPVLMRAYGNGSNAALLALGFQLVHAVHSCPEKNAAYIAMVIDAIESDRHQTQDGQYKMLFVCNR